MKLEKARQPTGSGSSAHRGSTFSRVIGSKAGAPVIARTSPVSTASTTTQHDLASVRSTASRQASCAWYCRGRSIGGVEVDTGHCGHDLADPLRDWPPIQVALEEGVSLNPPQLLVVDILQAFLAIPVDVHETGHMTRHLARRVDAVGLGKGVDAP